MSDSTDYINLPRWNNRSDRNTTDPQSLPNLTESPVLPRFNSKEIVALDHHPSVEHFEDTTSHDDSDVQIQPRWNRDQLIYENQPKTERQDSMSTEDRRIYDNSRRFSTRLNSSISSPSTNLVIEEFRPISSSDQIFVILRNLFVRSFEMIYKQIESDLNIPSDTNLLEWLDEKFDQEQSDILARHNRCFYLCNTKISKAQENILAFVSFHEENEKSIYISQLVVRHEIKRRGYGTQLLKYFYQIYPDNTKYSTVIRRVNRIAWNFYQKLGVTLIPDRDLKRKYGYDPEIFLGLRWNSTNLELNSTPMTNENVPQSSIQLTDDHFYPEASPPSSKRQKPLLCCIML